MSPNRRVELKGAGYLLIPDIILLTGIPEPDLRSLMSRYRICLQVRFGVEAVAESDARRLMELLGQTSISEERTVQPGFSLLRLRTLMRRGNCPVLC